MEHNGVTGLFQKTGRIIFVIAALEAYEESQRQGLPEIQQLSYLYQLEKQCRKWLQEKQGKQSQKSITRQFWVQKLSGEIPVEMASQFPDLWQALNTFDLKKAQSKANPIGPSFGPKGVYAHEKSLYRFNKSKGKYSDAGGARMTGSATLLHANGANTLDQKSHPNHRAFKKSSLAPMGMGQLSFPALSEPQFWELDKLCQGQFNVLYLSKIQRLQYMVNIDQGQLNRPDGTAITLMPGATVRNEIDHCPYAMDKYGNLFVTTEGDHQGIQINHTTLCAGGEVLCAGTMSIKNGELRAVNNNSGHYKPDTQNLQQLLTTLKKEGVNVDSVIVIDWAQGQLETMATLFMAGNYRRVPTVQGRIGNLLAKTN